MGIVEDLNNPLLTQAEVCKSFIELYKNHVCYAVYYFAKSDTLRIYRSDEPGFQVELIVTGRYGRTFCVNVNAVIMSDQVKPRIREIDREVVPHLACFA